MLDDSITRRHALALGGLSLAAGALVGCSSSVVSLSKPTTIEEIELLLSMELAVVNHYRAIADSIARGATPVSGPAMTRLVTIALAHHQAHRDKWNAVLRNSGGGVQASPAPKFTVRLGALRAQAKSAGDVLRSLSLAEVTAAETYAAAIGIFNTRDLREACAQITPVEGGHLAVIQLLLAGDPVPAALAGTDSVLQSSPAPRPTSS